jgi:hypothetical protein
VIKAGESAILFIGELGRLAIFGIATGLMTACTVRLVAPYNAELAQRASSMQSQVAAWDLTMRGGAGTVANDPRHPSVSAALNEWRGEADAMLTLAVSNDPGMINCSEAMRAASAAIETSIPAGLRVPTQPSGAPGTSAASPSGCEAELVAAIDTGIDDIEGALKYCRLSWVDDAYFADLSQNRSVAPKLPAAPNATAQNTLKEHCVAEFTAASNAPATSAGARHGRAVSELLTTLQAIVYIENRKKAAALSK